MSRHKRLPNHEMRLLEVPGTSSRELQAENFYNIGNAMGKAMLELLPPGRP